MLRGILAGRVRSSGRPIESLYAALHFSASNPALAESAEAADPSEPITVLDWRDGVLRDLKRSCQDVTVVDDRETARKALDALYANRNEFHAWDTETVGVDPKIESPVGHGRAICATAYCGKDVDFGSGPKLWIDNTDGTVLQYFKDYFEDPSTAKVWHNYGFDKHILSNEGIDCDGFYGDTMHMARLLDTSLSSYSLEAVSLKFLRTSVKTPMHGLFGRSQKLSTGKLGKKQVLPCLLDIQNSPADCQKWIFYATLDAKLTWELRRKLHELLLQKETEDMNGDPITLWDVYRDHLIPFGAVLTDIERVGFKLDVDMLRRAEAAGNELAEKDKRKFLDWLANEQPGAAKYMNLQSVKQKQNLFFAPCINPKTKERMPAACWHTAKVDRGGKIAKVDFTIRGLGIKPEHFTESGWPGTSQEVLSGLSNQASVNKNSDVYKALGESGHAALSSLCEWKALETLMGTYVRPLQSMVQPNGRVHASLNLNTETGRLSCRKPNLQNQPAADKDRVGIRKAFICEPGNKLIVADYAQLELRVLAHLANCRSMIEAFERGGDFHSRTAMSMYPHVRKAVEEGEVLLESESRANCGTPLLKDKFKLERKRAKTLNFSIAYGKTPRGLSKDWGVTRTEAEETVQLWYRDRPEVQVWQDQQKHHAFTRTFVTTMIGRRRDLRLIRSSSFDEKQRALRAAINAPVQGSAADLVMAAMVKIWSHPGLQKLQWAMVMQIHDEVVLEGPEESAEEASEIVSQILKMPFDHPLRVPLDIDLKTGYSWYEAK